MLNEFYIVLREAQEWFFGTSLMTDPFFGFVVDVFNAFLLLVVFYTLMLYPVKICIKLFKGWIKR